MAASSDTPSKPRVDRRRQRTRTEILDVARKIVLNDGLAAFSLTPVADELGLTKPALYYYFPSREALMAELLLSEFWDAAQEVETAVASTGSAVEAIEALMRTTFDRYRNRIELFRLVYSQPNGIDFAEILGGEEIDRIRPINDMLYAGTTARLNDDPRAIGFPERRNSRRFAFTAHMSVIGLLTMKSIVESVDDPLIHSDDDLVEDLIRTFDTAIGKEMS